MAKTSYHIDYYPGGSLMPGRSFNANGYRFGFNGQEMDNEVFNNPSTSYTAEFWQYDSRIGRRWNIDPVVKPWESSYATFGGNPIWFSDPKGDNASNPDWYKGEDGNTFWADSHEKEIKTENGKTAKNIGTTYSAPLAGGESFVNYYQNTPVGITEGAPLDFNSSQVAGYLIGNKSPLSSTQKNNYFSSYMSKSGDKFIQNGGWMMFAAMALPVAIEAGAAAYSAGLFSTNFTSATNIGWGFGNAAANTIAQAGVNDWDFSKVNYTNVAASAIFKSSFTSNLVGSAFEINLNKGYVGLGKDKPILNVVTETSIGFVTGYAAGTAGNSIAPTNFGQGLGIGFGASFLPSTFENVASKNLQINN